MADKYAGSFDLGINLVVNNTELKETDEDLKRTRELKIDVSQNFKTLLDQIQNGFTTTLKLEVDKTDLSAVLGSKGYLNDVKVLQVELDKLHSKMNALGHGSGRDGLFRLPTDKDPNRQMGTKTIMTWVRYYEQENAILTKLNGLTGSKHQITDTNYLRNYLKTNRGVDYVDDDVKKLIETNINPLTVTSFQVDPDAIKSLNDQISAGLQLNVNPNDLNTNVQQLSEAISNALTNMPVNDTPANAVIQQLGEEIRTALQSILEIIGNMATDLATSAEEIIQRRMQQNLNPRGNNGGNGDNGGNGGGGDEWSRLIAQVDRLQTRAEQTRGNIVNMIRNSAALQDAEGNALRQSYEARNQAIIALQDQLEDAVYDPSQNVQRLSAAINALTHILQSSTRPLAEFNTLYQELANEGYTDKLLSQAMSILGKAQSGITSTQKITGDGARNLEARYQALYNVIVSVAGVLENDPDNIGAFEFLNEHVKAAELALKAYNVELTQLRGGANNVKLLRDAFKKMGDAQNQSNKAIQYEGAEARQISEDYLEIVNRLEAAIGADNTQPDYFTNLNTVLEQCLLDMSQLDVRMKQVQRTASKVDTSTIDINALTRTANSAITKAQEKERALDGISTNTGAANGLRTRYAKAINTYVDATAFLNGADRGALDTSQINAWKVALDQLLITLSELEGEFKIIKADDSFAKQMERDTNATITFDTRLQRTTKTIKEYFNRNTAAFKYGGFASRRDNILSALDASGIDERGLKRIVDDFAKLQADITDAGVAGKTTGDKIKGMIQKFGGWTLVTRSIMKAKQVFMQMFTAVKQLDTAMVNLRKVSNGTAEDYANFFNHAKERAQKLGSSITDIIDATAEFSRLGFNLDESAKLGEYATIYSKVAEDLSASDAAQSIVSTMKAFNIEAENSIKIVDLFNYVGKISAQVCSNAYEENSYIG